MRIIHVHTCVCICLHLRKTNKTETRSEKNGSTAPLVVRMSTRYLYLKELYYITYTVYFYAFVSLCVQHFVELGECASLPFMLCVCWLAHKYFCNVSRVCQLGREYRKLYSGFTNTLQNMVIPDFWLSLSEGVILFTDCLGDREKVCVAIFQTFHKSWWCINAFFLLPSSWFMKLQTAVLMVHMDTYMYDMTFHISIMCGYVYMCVGAWLTGVPRVQCWYAILYFLCWQRVRIFTEWLMCLSSCLLQEKDGKTDIDVVKRLIFMCM